MARFAEDDELLNVDPVLLFSVNSKLAFRIAEKYYQGVHYAWFAPRFDFGNLQPASSNPRSICNHILISIVSHDTHCEKLKRIRQGMREGARVKLKNGIITEDQELEIRALIERSEVDLSLMMPVVFVGAWHSLKDSCEVVPVEDAASKNSKEYIGRNLPRELFDVIDVEKILSNIDSFERRELF